MIGCEKPDIFDQQQYQHLQLMATVRDLQHVVTNHVDKLTLEEAEHLENSIRGVLDTVAVRVRNLRYPHHVGYDGTVGA